MTNKRERPTGDRNVHPVDIAVALRDGMDFGGVPIVGGVEAAVFVQVHPVGRRPTSKSRVRILVGRDAAPRFRVSNAVYLAAWYVVLPLMFIALAALWIASIVGEGGPVSSAWPTALVGAFFVLVLAIMHRMHTAEYPRWMDGRIRFNAVEHWRMDVWLQSNPAGAVEVLGE